jgi:hypothetical protein
MQHNGNEKAPALVDDKNLLEGDVAQSEKNFTGTDKAVVCADLHFRVFVS